jgi:uncharacterized protein (TIGR02265 family)
MDPPNSPAALLSELAKGPVHPRLVDWLIRALGPEHPVAKALGPEEDPELSEGVSLARWREALALAFEHAPGRSPEERWRWIGGRMSEGFFQSELGALVAQSLHGAQAERYISIIPKVIALGRSDMGVEIRPASDGGWWVEIEDDRPRPEFVAGWVEGALRRAEPHPKVVVTARGHSRYTLHASW